MIHTGSSTSSAYHAGRLYAIKVASSAGARLLGGIGGGIGGGLLGAELGLEGSSRLDGLDPQAVVEALGLLGTAGGGVAGAVRPRLGAILAGAGAGSQFGGLGGYLAGKALGLEGNGVGEGSLGAAGSIGKLLGTAAGGLGAHALTR